MRGWSRTPLLGFLLGWAACGASGKGTGPEPIVESEPVVESEPAVESEPVVESEPEIEWKWTCTATATGRDRLFGAQVSATISVSENTEADARQDLQDAACLIYKDCGQLQDISCDERDEP